MVPPNEMSISIEDSWVVLDLAGKKVDFLIDMETTYFVLISHAGPFSSKSHTMMMESLVPIILLGLSLANLSNG